MSSDLEDEVDKILKEIEGMTLDEVMDKYGDARTRAIYMQNPLLKAMAEKHATHLAGLASYLRVRRCRREKF